MMDDEKKYYDLIKTLKGLQQVKAPPNFETDLRRKLNEERFDLKTKRGVKDFFVPSKLIPSFGIIGAVIVMFIILNLNSEQAENPFMVEPKVREDILKVEEIDALDLPVREKTARTNANDGKELVDKKNNELRRNEKNDNNLPESSILSENETILKDSIMTDNDEMTSSDEYSAPRATGLAIRKSGLNFRQVNPTKVEQEEIQQLKKNVQIKAKEKKID